MRQPQQREMLEVNQPLAMRAFATHRQRVIKLLIAHDQAAEVELWLQELKNVQFVVSADVAQTPEAFATRLRSQEYDVVLATGEQQNWTVGRVLEPLRFEDKNIPFIFLG